MSKKIKDKVINSNPITKTITISKINRKNWLDGVEIYYKLPRDERLNDFNPYNYFDEPNENVYLFLRQLAKTSFDLNAIPDEIVKCLDEFEILSEVADKYAKHIFGLILKLK